MATVDDPNTIDGPNAIDDELNAFFRTKYTDHYSQAARRLEERALGHAVGLHGYTTLAQADVLADLLALAPDHWLLDLGAGRGWPGIQIARRSRAHLIALDLPYDALHAARAAMPAPDAGQTRAAVVADGRCMPLYSATMDAIVHADAF